MTQIQIYSLRSPDLCALDETWQRLSRRRPHPVVEVELEHGDHQPHRLLGVVHEMLLQLAGVADQHLAGGGLVLEA